MASKVLVTGGAGFIGSHLTNELIKKKYKVLVVDNLTTKGGIHYINPKSKFIKGDVTNKIIIKKIKKWCPKIIFHLAAQSSGEPAYDDPKVDYLSNGYGTYLISELAKEIKVKKIIYTSSCAVYGSALKKRINENTAIKPDSIYGVSKYAGEMFIEQVLKNTKTRTIIFRIFNTYGPGENLNFLKKGMVSIYSSYLWRKKPIIVKGSLERVRNFQYVDDVVNILVKSITNKNLKKNETINLTCGKKVKIRKLIELILSINNKNFKNYIVKEMSGTLGDSIVFDASNKYLSDKLNKYKFISLEKGLKKYFKWINKIPVTDNLSKWHPLMKN
jgi:UDP-glucose 4-epimerase